MGVRLSGALALVAGALLMACGETGAPVADVCPDCAIQLEFVATVGAGTGEGALDEQMQFVVRDATGRFFVTSNVEALPYIYDERGDFLGRLGTQGEGPGEFTAAAAVHFWHDSVFVYDRRQSRVSVFDSDLEFVRSIAGISPYYSAVTLAGGRFLADNMRVNARPLTVYDPQGTPVAHLGDEIDTSNPQQGFLHQVHALAPSSSGGAWSIKRFFRPVVQEWDSRGRLLREFDLTVDWYEPFDERRNLSPDVRPQPFVTGIWEDVDGRVWIVGLAADEDWVSGFGEPVSGEGGVVYSPVEDAAGVFDTFITVLDPAADRAVLHQRRFDRALRSFEPGLVIDPRPNDLGFVALDVYRVEFVAK